MAWVCEDFGVSKDGRQINKYTSKNEGGIEVSIINFGGIITSLKAPDKYGQVEDIVAGYDTLQEYEAGNPDYFGAIIGRTANRIAQGRFSLDGEEYQLDVNNGPNTNHGGSEGFHTKVWTPSLDGSRLKLNYTSADGEQGYPGQVDVCACFQLEPDNTLVIDFVAKTNKPTIVNVTSHSYFNLAGHKTPTLKDHTLHVNADRFTPKRDHGIPNGELASVTGSVFDLRSPTLIADQLDKVPGGEGYDHNFCINGDGPKRFAAKLEHGPSGRTVDVYTNQPGLQVYTGHYVNVRGKETVQYNRYSSVALEAQNYPDAINQPSFPSPILRPEQTYHHTTWYTFGVNTS